MQTKMPRGTTHTYPKSLKTTCRISSYSCRGNYSFLEVGVRQVFKGGNYSREETIVFFTYWKNISTYSKEWKKKIDKYLQGQPLGFDTKYLALADRNMQVRFSFKVIWES